MTIYDWLYGICVDETPGVTIIAYNFGIFETNEGYTLYLAGSKIFDRDDDDWASNIHFEPKINYLALDKSEYKGLKWELVLEKIRSQLLEFSKTDKFKHSFFVKAQAITVGFDDGDLLRIK